MKGLNPGVVSKVGWVWSSGWTQSWIGLTVTDVSTTCAVVIFRVKVSCITSVDDIILWLLVWLVNYIAMLLVVCQLKAHVHPNGFARLGFCFETILLSNAVVWLASTFEERSVTILKTTAREINFFHACPKLTETVSKRPVRTLILFQMEQDISLTSLNVTGESSSKFKLVVNAYGYFESDEHSEGHIITKRLSTRWDFPEARFDCEIFWFLNLLFCVNS